MEKMNVLILGSGGREHALAWKIKQSPLLDTLYVAPGNAGIAELAEIAPVDMMDAEAIANFAEAKKIGFVVVGPEAPLCEGIADGLRERGIEVFGPSKAAATLEGSKVYAKEFMMKHGIPTAKYQSFSNSEEAIAALDSFGLPVVIKADGLAAGKGVIIPSTKEEASLAIRQIMDEKRFGDSGNEIVLEEFLTGIEASQLCFVDGKRIVPLDSVRDYKRAYDDDKGENTGGMGTFSPNPIIDEAMKAHIYEEILLPFLKGLQADGLDYRGLVFVGLMIKDGAAKVIEFNVRFGDPETQSLLPRLKSDLLELMLKTASQELDSVRLEWDERASVTVIVASGGYPDAYEKGKVISGLDQVEGVRVFHSASAEQGGALVTSGGRVLGVNALAPSIEEARNKVYEELKKIHFEGAFYRSDIAAKVDF